LEHDYASPVAHLLTLGDPHERRVARTTPDPELTAADVPELVRMALDPALHEAGAEAPEVFAPVYAWRALGRLRAAEAAEPLIQLLEERHDDDWVFEEIPEVLGWIGPAALPLAEALLQREEVDLFLRVAAARVVSLIGTRHPESRDQAVAILARQLEAWDRQDATLNAFLIIYLGDHRAVGAAPLMRAAFEEGAVDTSVCGDWEDAQVELGLLDARIHPRPRLIAHLMDGFATPVPVPRQPRPGGRAQSAARRKAQKASRKRNRKRR
jgi:Protein of unknown function (DUF1186)